MQAVREYAAGIAAAAMICAITLSFAGSGTMKPLMKLICGLVLTFAVVAPVLTLKTNGLSDLHADFRLEGESAAAEGRQMARQALEDIIIQRTQAYIEDKASRMGLSIRATVELSQEDPPVPGQVTIQGALSPYDHKQLYRFLRENLGLGEEDLQWIP